MITKHQAAPIGEASGKTGPILDAAQALFAAFGYRRTSIDAIAQKAGMAKGTIYLYFSSKEMIFRAVHARTLAEISRDYDKIEALDVNFEDKFQRMLAARCGRLQMRYAQSEHLLELGETRDTLAADLAQAADADHAARLEQLCSQAEAAGEIDLGSTGLDARSLVAVAMAAARGARTEANRPVDTEAYQQKLRDIARVTAHSVRPAVTLAGGGQF